MKKHLILLVFILSGCAAHVTKVNVAGLEHSKEYPLQDLRPASEKESEIFSLFIGSDSYGLYRVAESAIEPSPIRIFQHRVFEKTEGVGVSPKVKVRHLVIYKNLQGSLRRGMVGFIFAGAVGATLTSQPVESSNGVVTTLIDTSMFDSVASEEYKRAMTSEKENPENNASLIIFIDTEINQKNVFTRTFVPLKNNTDESYFLTILDETIKSHLSYY